MIASQGTAPLSIIELGYFLSLSSFLVLTIFSLCGFSTIRNKSDSNFEREGREAIKTIFKNLLTETKLAVAWSNVSGWSFYVKTTSFITYLNQQSNKTQKQHVMWRVDLLLISLNKGIKSYKQIWLYIYD